MKLPKRVPQHISESDSFKILSDKIPSSWIIRQVTERDYGIDCYLELVSESNELTGELALIQLKSRQEIQWTKEDYYTISDIDITTSNYWFRFQVPVFVFVADVKNKALYFVSVGYYIRRNFADFIKQDKFSYRVKKMNKFEGADGVFHFKFNFYYDYYRKQFENELIFFLSNILHHRNFIEEHWNRDIFLGVDLDQLIIAESIYRNYKFLSGYLGLTWDIPTIKELKKNSQDKFGTNYEIYEADLAELVKQLDTQLKNILPGLKSFLHGEMYYWMTVDKTTHDFVRNLDEHGNYSGY